MKHPLYTTTGKSTTQIDLPESLFGHQPDANLLALYRRVFLFRNRQGTRKTITKFDLSMTTAKMWRQKGTGRARHGSAKAPQFVGGIKAHGPTGFENFTLKLPKRVKKLALPNALSSSLDRLVIVDGFDKLTSTSKIAQALASLPNSSTKSTLLVLDAPTSPLIRAAKNLSHVTTTQAARINAYEVLASNHLVITKSALTVLEKTFAPTTAKPTPASKPTPSAAKTTRKPKTTKPTTKA